MAILRNQAMGSVCFGLMVPGVVLALMVLAKKTKDTKGVEFE